MKTLMTLLILYTSAVSGLSGWSPTASIQITSPQKYSASIGMSSVDLFGSDSGFLIRLEPGFSGGKLHAGTRNMVIATLIPFVSTDVTAAIMHTWNDPCGRLLNHQTYAGMEIRLGILPLVITAGYYNHIAGSDTEHNWITSLGIGAGF